MKSYDWKKVESLWELRNSKIDQRRSFKDLTFHDWLCEISPEYNWEWHYLKYIQESIADINAGIPRKLMIFCPPRHGKSEMLTVRFPIYCLRRNPKMRVIVGAYNQDFANLFSRKSRKLARSELILNPDRMAVTDWETIQGGGYKAVGVGGGVTGRGGNLILVDDPVKNRESANSEVFREKVWNWWNEDLCTRMEPNASIILIMTRWHEDDLAGRLLTSEEIDEWEVISFPAIAQEADLLGRQEGEALCPDRYPIEELLKIKSRMTREGDSYSFGALYQQNPTPREGGIIPINDFVPYRELPDFDYIAQGWDTAFKTKEENDFSLCLTVGVSKRGYYIIDRWKGKVTFPDLKIEVKRLAYKYNPDVILIEDAASGQSLIQEMKIDSRLPIVPIKVDRDKISRANACTSIISSRRVFIPEDEWWLADFLEVLRIFPNGKHDDDVDVLTMCLNYLSKRFSNTFPVYPDYNDLIHIDEFSILENVKIIQLNVGLYVDSISTAVIVGIDEINNTFVLAEKISESGLESLLQFFILPFLKDNFPDYKVGFNVMVSRKDSAWVDTFNEFEIEYQNISNFDLYFLIENIQSMLSKLNKGRPILTVLYRDCPLIREGFKGAYSYRPRNDITNIDFHEKPTKNKYARVHLALQAAFVDYNLIVEERKKSEPLFAHDEYEEGRSDIGGY